MPQIPNVWNGGGIVSHPDIVRQVHRDYLEDGAQIIIANTFATSPHLLAAAGESDALEAYNGGGVRLALEAREAAGAHSALVAGGISHWSFDVTPPSLLELRDGAAMQARMMAAAGADFIALEMMAEHALMLATLDGALEAGLPVWVGLSCEPDRSGHIALLGGEPLADAVASAGAHGASLVGIMHTDVRHVHDALDIVRAGWDGETFIYAHSGEMVDGEWTFDDVIAPHDYASHAASWISRDVRIVGGCCGIGPRHMACVRPLMSEA